MGFPKKEMAGQKWNLLAESYSDSMRKHGPVFILFCSRALARGFSSSRCGLLHTVACHMAAGFPLPCCCHAQTSWLPSLHHCDSPGLTVVLFIPSSAITLQLPGSHGRALLYRGFGAAYLPHLQCLSHPLQSRTHSTLFFITNTWELSSPKLFDSVNNKFSHLTFSL